MTGRELYDKYQYHMANQGVEIDEFVDLDLDSKECWEALAKEVSWIGAL